jgi:hypothetical protein
LLKRETLPIPKKTIINILSPSWKLDNASWIRKIYEGNLVICLTPWTGFPERFGIRQYMLDVAKDHELGHAWGIDACSNAFCLMFESRLWGSPEAWWEPYVHGLCGLLSGFRFCGYHREFLDDEIAKVSEIG